MTPPNFNVQKIMFIGHEAQFYLKEEVDTWVKENVEQLEEKQAFDANREVYVDEYRKCQKAYKLLAEEVTYLRQYGNKDCTAMAYEALEKYRLERESPSVGNAPSLEPKL